MSPALEGLLRLVRMVSFIFNQVLFYHLVWVKQDSERLESEQRHPRLRQSRIYR